MITNYLNKILSFSLAFSLSAPSLSWAAEPAPRVDIELQDLALPTEVRDLTKQAGSVYYSTTSKNKPLMPVHFWGEVGKPGLHYIPLDTKLVKGLSFAGGGSSSANLDHVIVNRLEKDQVVRKVFDLDEGGDYKSHEFSLNPGDTIFIEKDRTFENRAFYLSIATLAATIISTILIVKRIERIERE